MKKRVLCLYRVSTKQQVDRQDDIPMQRRECMDFIQRQPDWEFMDERLEKGVSGFKVSAEKRDAIIEIRAMAERKEFDVLLVFMFDRLGRRDDETPFLVEWFINHGIEVWSTREGQQKLENRGDKLINYIRFWMAGGESEKTSMRVKAAHTQMVADGIWRGGTRPYGYKLVHKGRIGKKNRQLYDLEIDEVEGPIVKEIFAMMTVEGYGTLRAANELNRRYPNPDKVWTAQTIRSMLRNPMYTGRLHMNDMQSSPNEALRLVSDADFSFAQYCMKQRIPCCYRESREAENATVPDGQTKASVFGATLLSGLLYCGHCGCKLVGGYCTKQRAKGPYHRPVYRCYNGSVKAKLCDGQTVYSALKIEEAVLEVVNSYFSHMKSTVDSAWHEQARRQMHSKHSATVKILQTSLANLRNDEIKLHEEIVKSLSGLSRYSDETLSMLLESTQQKLQDTEAKLEHVQMEREQEDSRIRYLGEQYSNIRSWADEFMQADPDHKKMILSRLIQSITVDRNYHITINFFISLEDFQQEMNTLNEKLTVQESETVIESAVS